MESQPDKKKQPFRPSPELSMGSLSDLSTDLRINRVIVELSRRCVPYATIRHTLRQKGKRSPEALLRRLLHLLDP
jgi:hypothetical protein